MILKQIKKQVVYHITWSTLKERSERGPIEDSRVKHNHKYMSVELGSIYLISVLRLWIWINVTTADLLEESPLTTNRAVA